MSLLTLLKAQFGKSNTPANNFVLDASADNGTMKLARGNAGATTQDILTVDASGDVLVGGNNLNLFSAKSFAANGYQKLPSGLIIQWGAVTGVSVSGTGLSFSFPTTFPNACLQVVHSGWASMGVAQFANANIQAFNASGVTNYQASANLSGTFSFRWVAIGW